MGFNSVNNQVSEAVADAREENYLLGVVVDNVDPAGLNRIKVRVPNFWEPDQGELPWVAPHPYSPFGIGDGFGTYGSPAIGAEVRVWLQEGNAAFGLYEASNYSKANPKFKDPKTWGFKDPSGNELFVNMETNLWVFTHSSGVKLTYNQSGDEIHEIVRNLQITVGGNESRTVQGDVTHQIQGQLNITVQGDVNLTSSGSVNIQGNQINLN